MHYTLTFNSEENNCTDHNVYWIPIAESCLKPAQQKILHESSTWRIQGESEFLTALLTMSYNTLIWRPFWFHTHRLILFVNCFQGELLSYNFPPYLSSYLLVHLPLTWTLIKNGAFCTNCAMHIFKKLLECGLLIIKYF